MLEAVTYSLHTKLILVPSTGRDYKRSNSRHQCIQIVPRGTLSTEMPQERLNTAVIHANKSLCMFTGTLAPLNQLDIPALLDNTHTPWRLKRSRTRTELTEEQNTRGR